MRLEIAGDKDIKELVNLYVEGYRGLEIYAYTHRKDVEAYIDWLRRRDKEGVIVAKEDGKIIGFIGSDASWFSKREGRKVGAIHELVVAEDHRRKGIGTALIEFAVRRFGEKGLEIVELWVGDGNSVARKFYERLGFEEAGSYNYWVRMRADRDRLEERLRELRRAHGQ